MISMRVASRPKKHWRPYWPKITLEDMHAGPEQGTDEKSQTDHSQIDYSIEIHG